jgi:hypothetical protein
VEAHALLVLAVGAIGAEVMGLWGSCCWGATPRQGIRGGVHLGVLILPWVFASRVAAAGGASLGVDDHDGAAFHLFAFWTSAAAGSATLAHVALGGGACESGGAGWLLSALVVGATSAVGAHRLLATEVQPSNSAANALLAVVIVLHAYLALVLARVMLRAFPGAATLAEASLAAQGLSLCIGDTAMVAVHAAVSAARHQVAAVAAAAVDVANKIVIGGGERAGGGAGWLKDDDTIADAGWRRQWLPAHAGSARGDVQHAITANILLACALVSVMPAWRAGASESKSEGKGYKETDKRRRRRRHSTHLSTAASVAAAAVAVAGFHPLAWFVGYVWSQSGLLHLASYWCVISGVSLAAIVKISSRRSADAGAAPLPTIFLRKTYHLMAVAMFLPPSLPRRVTGGLLPPPELLALAYAVALAVFAIAEVARVARVVVPIPSFLLRIGGGGGGGSGVGGDINNGSGGVGDGCDDSGVSIRRAKMKWPAKTRCAPKAAKGVGGPGGRERGNGWREVAVGAELDTFMSRFTDARDCGGESGIILSHFSLLLGLAVPLWMTQECWDGRCETHSSAAEAGAGTGAGVFMLSPFAGIITLGLGDTAASVVGVTFGRHKLCPNWHKSVEGTLANAGANLAGARVVWGLIGGGGAVPWTCIVVASLGAAALEAVTAQLDNAFLPLHFVALAQLTAAL